MRRGKGASKQRGRWQTRASALGASVAVEQAAVRLSRARACGPGGSDPPVPVVLHDHDRSAVDVGRGLDRSFTALIVTRCQRSTARRKVTGSTATRREARHGSMVASVKGSTTHDFSQRPRKGTWQANPPAEPAPLPFLPSRAAFRSGDCLLQQSKFVLKCHKNRR